MRFVANYYNIYVILYIYDIYYDEAIHQRNSKVYIWVYTPRLRLVCIYPPPCYITLVYVKLNYQ